MHQLKIKEMKKLLIILVTTFSLFSCSKENVIPANGDPKTDFAQKILDGNFVTSIAFDSKGNAWIGTFQQGLVMYNSKKTLVFNSTNSVLPENSVINDIKVDSKDNVWIGCEGLLKFDGANFTLYNSTNSGLPEDYVKSIAIDSKDNIWMTSSRFKRGGLVKYDGSRWQVFTPSNSPLPVNFVQSLAIDHDDNVWLAFGEKVNGATIARITGNNWKIYTPADLGFTPYYFGNIDINSNDEICGAIDYSLSSSSIHAGPQVFRFDGNDSRQLNFNNTSSVMFLTVDKDDNIWCGLFDSFAVYNGTQWIIDNTTFKEVGVFSIKQAPDSKIWIGTSNGIYINRAGK